MAGKINSMPTKHNLNRDIRLRVMWKKFSDVGRGRLREGEIIGHLSVGKTRQKQGIDRNTSKMQ